MRKFLVILASCGLAAAWTPAFADPSQPYGMDRNSGHQSAGDDLPHCDRPIGVAAVKEPDRDWWSPLGLGNPESVLKMFALRSGCLRMVDRNQGLAMREQERSLSSSGELQRGSNIGRGQVLAADYFIVPDIQRANQDSGGGNVGAAFGHFMPGGFGAVEAGGYSNTDIGKVIMAAYYKAFVDLVHYMQAQQPGAQQASAPLAAQAITRDVQLRAGPSVQARIVYTLHSGALVYPTGQRNGVWMEVDDENGNRGWMSSALATVR